MDLAAARPGFTGVANTIQKHTVDPAVDNIVNAYDKEEAARTDVEQVISMAEELIGLCPEGHVFNVISAQWLLHLRELVRTWAKVEGHIDRLTNLGHKLDVLELANLHGRARTPGTLTQESKISWWNLHKKGSTSAKVSLNAQKLITRYKDDLKGGDPSKVYTRVEGSPEFKCPSMPEYMSLECRSETMDKIISSIQNHQFTQIYGPAGIGKTFMLGQIVKQIGDKFKGVAHVQVLRSPKIFEIQKTIAKKLGVPLEDTNTDVADRAETLTSQINKIEKVLLILDDVWGDLNLQTIGIPRGRNVKFLIGTRMSNLPLNSYDNKISVGFLNKEDSWLLFKKAASLSGLEGNGIIEIAKAVRQRCFGLPLALAVIGRTLSGEKEELTSWKNALKYLKEHSIKKMSTRNTGHATEFLCQVIEYSYKYHYTNKIDLLKADRIDVAKAENIARRIFRLCSLFPENDVIPREDLKKYLIAEDPKLESKHFDSAILKLLQCHLLEQTDSGFLKMHAVVRDVAVYLAEKEDYAFINCGTTINLSEGIVTSNGTVSVIGCTIKETDGFKEKSFFGKKHCGHVRTLLFRNNESQLPDLPPSFFERMGDLTVLDLSHSEITKLPASMKKLGKVKTLLLNGCKKLEEAKDIGALKGLLVLSLREHSLRSLPSGMKSLVNLIVLDLSPAEKCNIADRFFTVLPKLQELFLASESLSSNAFMEIVALQKLIALRLWVYSTVLCSPEFRMKFGEDGPLTKESEFTQWSKFTIFFKMDAAPGTPMVTSASTSTSSVFTIPSDLNYPRKLKKKNLHIMGLTRVYRGAKLLLREAQNLIIEECFPTETDLDFLTAQDETILTFEKTQRLHLKNCSNIKYLTSGGSSGWGKLEQLELTDLHECEGIYADTVSNGPLKVVEVITIRECNKIGRVMPANLEQKVQKTLQKISVISCGNVRCIFDNYSGLFNVLKLIKVQGLPILDNIWVTDSLIGDIWVKDTLPPQGSFANLLELIVINCEKLVFVFTPKLAAMLTSLQKLIVEGNRGMEAIIQLDGDITALDENVFAKVNHVSIQNLEKLQHFHGQQTDENLKWPSLALLRLGGCKALTRFPIGQTSAPYMTRIDVTSEDDKKSLWYKELVELEKKKLEKKQEERKEENREEIVPPLVIRVAYDPDAEDE